MKFYHCWPRGLYYSVSHKWKVHEYGGSNFTNIGDYRRAYRLHMKQPWKIRHMDVHKNVPWLMRRGWTAYCIMKKRETKRWNWE